MKVRNAQHLLMCHHRWRIQMTPFGVTVTPCQVTHYLTTVSLYHIVQNEWYITVSQKSVKLSIYGMNDFKIVIHDITVCDWINTYQTSCPIFPTAYECIDESTMNPEIQGKSRMMSSQGQGSQVANPRTRSENSCIGRQHPQKASPPSEGSASESSPIRLSNTPSETSVYDEGTSWCPPSYDKLNPATMEAYYEKLNPATME